MADGLRIIVNGRERTLEALGEQESLQGVLAALELKADRIAVEHNGEIAPRASWPSTPVASGDRLEVVHFVGGGVADGPGAVADGGSLHGARRCNGRASVEITAGSDR